MFEHPLVTGLLKLCPGKTKYTLVYQIEVQAQINVQVGEFLKINKRAVQNKRAGETSCKRIVKCTGLN